MMNFLDLDVLIKGCNFFKGKAGLDIFGNLVDKVMASASRFLTINELFLQRISVL